MTNIKTTTIPWVKKCCSYFPLDNNYLKFLLLTTLFFTLSSFDFDKNNKERSSRNTNATNQKSTYPRQKIPFAGGDFSLDFAASNPSTYNHSTGGGNYGDGSNSFVVESLEGGDFACGDIVTVLTAIKVDAGATGSQTFDINYSY